MFGLIDMPLLVKTKVKKSKIEGLGLFADEDIRQGQIIWSHDFEIDGWFYADQLPQYSEATIEYIKHFCCYDKDVKGWIKACDNANWMNHSNDPNVESPNYYTHTAKRTIYKGEELTIDYDTIGDNDEFFGDEFTTS